MTYLLFSLKQTIKEDVLQKIERKNYSLIKILTISLKK